MAVSAFLSALQESGELRISSDPLQETDRDELLESLRELERINRLELPAAAPPFQEQAALWAASRFYQACQFLVYREIDGEQVLESLTGPGPEPKSPAVVYSVDLVFRYLPDLLTLARGLSPDDPLVSGLKALARGWPLSSVGLALEGLEPEELNGFIEDPCLRQLYIDRVIAKEDRSRLGDPRVRDGIRAAAGMHGDRLCAALLSALERAEDEDEEIDGEA